MRRRSFVSAVPAGLVASTGCLGSDEQLSRLAWINLQNHREEEYGVKVTVEDDDGIVFSNTYHLGTDDETGKIFEENPVDGEGAYVVHATLDDEEREVDTTDFIDGDETCIGVQFNLLNNGSVDYDTKSMQEC